MYVEILSKVRASVCIIIYGDALITDCWLMLLQLWNGVSITAGYMAGTRWRTVEWENVYSTTGSQKNFFSITGSLYKQVYTPEIKGSNKDADVYSKLWIPEWAHITITWSIYTCILTFEFILQLFQWNLWKLVPRK